MPQRTVKITGKNSSTYIISDTSIKSAKKTRNAKMAETKESMKKLNWRESKERCWRVLIENFVGVEDAFWGTYSFHKEHKKRPSTYEELKKEASRFLSRLRYISKKNNRKLDWVQTLERGAKGGLHLHLVTKGVTRKELKEAWGDRGYTKIDELDGREKKFLDTAAYMTKERTKGGERSWSCSRGLERCDKITVNDYEMSLKKFNDISEGVAVPEKEGYEIAGDVEVTICPVTKKKTIFIRFIRKNLFDGGERTKKQRKRKMGENKKTSNTNRFHQKE